MQAYDSLDFFFFRLFSTYHSDRLRLDHSFGGDSGEVGQVGQYIHDGHYRHGDDDGERQVPTERRTILIKRKTVFLTVQKSVM